MVRPPDAGDRVAAAGVSQPTKPGDGRPRAFFIMSDPKPFVGVVGASARAAVHSLYRAGYGAWAVDLFTDRDLFATSARCPLDEYPWGLPPLADQFFPGPVLYTGGLENHPDVVAELAARRPLWGNPPAVLEVVRDPFFPGRVWPKDDDLVRCPRVLPGDAVPADGIWLVKPRRCAGGYGIRQFHPANAVPDPDAHYLQEYVTGEPMSAVCVARAGEVQVLGVAEQLNNVGWLHVGFFRYGGNVGPVELPAATADTFTRFVAALAWAGGLVGLFGVDFILDADDVAWPVELNPRYTGSVEVLEHATGRAVMLDHAAAFGAGGTGRRSACDPTLADEVPGKVGASSPPFPPREGGPGGLGGSARRSPGTDADVVNPSPGPSPKGGGVPAQQSLPTPVSPQPGVAPVVGGSGLSALRRNPRHRVVGKAVYYAPFPIRFPAAGPWDDWDRPFDPWNLPAFADIPAAGCSIGTGDPVFTLFEAGSSPDAVRDRLQSRAMELDWLFVQE